MKNQEKYFLKFGFQIYSEQFLEERRLIVHSTPFLI